MFRVVRVGFNLAICGTPFPSSFHLLIVLLVKCDEVHPQCNVSLTPPISSLDVC